MAFSELSTAIQANPVRASATATSATTCTHAITAQAAANITLAPPTTWSSDQRARSRGSTHVPSTAPTPTAPSSSP